MHLTNKTIFVSAFCLAFSLLVFPVYADLQRAQDFQLENVNGGLPVKLSDYKGKVVFLDFWATWCPPCRESIPAIKELHKTMADNSNVAILGINVGEKKADVEKFVRQNAISYSILLGDEKTSGNYKVSGIPVFFIINKNGEIAKRYVGYFRGLEKEWLKTINELSK
jgi:thiol-disulfide isomerase/thioredoxin